MTREVTSLLFPIVSAVYMLKPVHGVMALCTGCQMVLDVACRNP